MSRRGECVLAEAEPAPGAYDGTRQPGPPAGPGVRVSVTPGPRFPALSPVQSAGLDAFCGGHGAGRGRLAAGQGCAEFIRSAVTALRAAKPSASVSSIALRP